MFKELLILSVVVAFSLLTYYLVEPFAHHAMHPHVESKHFAYADLPEVTKTGNAEAGKALAVDGYACVACHSIESQGLPATMDAVTAAQSYGVNPPDLSVAGGLYDAKFLAALVKNPAHALNLDHKYPADGTKVHPMSSFAGMGGDLEQEVADIVAYLVSISPKSEEITDKVAYENACGRCHALRYNNWTPMGDKPRFKYKQDELRFDASVLDYQASVTKYMGKLPPDLSMYYRSRGPHFIETLIEDPQSQLKGTAMPRVGVTAESAEKVIAYLEEAADPHAEARNSLGKNVMIYMIFFILFAFLWKKQVWKKLH